jgi:hypothetical protein
MTPGDDGKEAGRPKHVAQGVELDDEDAAAIQGNMRAASAFRAVQLVEFARLVSAIVPTSGLYHRDDHTVKRSRTGSP